MDVKALGENLGLDEDEYLELIELFLDSGKSDYNGLMKAIGEKDLEKIKTFSHTLAGAAGNLGLDHIYEPAKEIEMSADSSEMDALAEKANVVGKFIDELESLI